MQLVKYQYCQQYSRYYHEYNKLSYGDIKDNYPIKISTNNKLKGNNVFTELAIAYKN